MFPTMDRFGPDFLALVALGAAALGRPTRATGQADVWRPRTVPLYGVSYAPDIGFQLGAGLVHTRYGFRALPASTRLIVTADRKSTRLNSSHGYISYAVFCLKKKKTKI